MSRSTALTAGRRCPAVAAVLACCLLCAAPAAAHDEGLTPYHYVAAPPGVSSQGPAESGSSIQALGEFGFAGTTDNQMQLTLPEGALLPRRGDTGVRVQLDQLAPASLPDLPDGLEPEGNGYRVGLTYVPSGAALEQLATPATLGLSAPAPPTEVYELIDRTWQKVDFTPVTADAGATSVVALDGPGTFLQAYDPTGAPTPASPASPAAPVAASSASPAAPEAPTPGPSPRSAVAATERAAPRWAWLLAVGSGGALLVSSGLAVLRLRRRQQER